MMTEPTRLRRNLARTPWQIVVPVATFLLLVLTGTTTSSIGLAELRQDPSAPLGHQLGAALSIRSDEFLTATPYALGVAATGSTDDLNPLTAPSTFVSLLGDGPFATILLFDGAWMRAGTFLPVQMLFAARWWLPTLLLLLSAPAYFHRATGNRWIGWAVAGLMIASPLAAWWSLSPLSMVGFTMAGSVALMNTARRWEEHRRSRAIAWAAVAAVLLARTPLHYQPWAIVVAVAVLALAVVVTVLDASSRRTGSMVVVVVGVAAAALLSGFLTEAWPSLQATTHTLYPGRRVSTGTAVSFGQIFGAVGLGSLEYEHVVGSNDSEISSAYAVAAVLALFVATRRLRFATVGHRAATWLTGGLTAFWFSWAMLEYGTVGARLPVVNLVPPSRAADVLGFLAVILLALVLAASPERSGWRFGLVAAATTALVSSYGVSVLRAQSLPTMPISTVWGTGAIVAIVSFLIATRPRELLGYAIAVLGGTALVFRVNPVIIGVGDLRASAVAQQMITAGQLDRASGTVWATDSLYVDALLISTGVPSLSSRQLAGPDVDRWRALAPGTEESVWNRGASFITFTWTDGAAVQVDNPQPDLIVVHASPCTVADRLPELHTVVSGHPLEQSCLASAGTFQWGGQTEYRYTVTR